MLIWHFRFVLRWKFTFGHEQARIIIWPLLNFLFLFAVMKWSIGCISVWIKIISVRIHIIPCSQLWCWIRLAPKMILLSTYGIEGHPHWMFIKHCYRHHFIKFAIVWKIILCKVIFTEYVVVPSIGPWSLNPSGHVAKSALGPCRPLWYSWVVEFPVTFLGPRESAVF